MSDLPLPEPTSDEALTIQHDLEPAQDYGIARRTPHFGLEVVTAPYSPSPKFGHRSDFYTAFFEQARKGGVVGGDHHEFLATEFGRLQVADAQ